MATFGANDALYGTGVFGTARFGRVTPVIAVTGVSGTGEIEPPEIGGFEVDIGVRLTATTVGTGSVGSIPTSQVHVGAGLTGVTSTVSIGQVSIASSQSLTGVVGTVSLGVVSPNIKTDITGVLATGSVGSVVINTGAGITTPTITSNIGFTRSNVIAVQFDYVAVAHLYSKRRAVTIDRAA